MTKGLLNTNAGTIPVMHMVAIQGSRIEPITYWIRVGDTVVRGAFEQNMARIRYGLTGKVPDGLLVRVSSISSNVEKAYHIQQGFITAMLLALSRTNQEQLIGRNAL
jgi:EpsI family protein